MAEASRLDIESVRVWPESKLTALTTGNNDDSITFAKGTANQILKRVLVSVPAAVGDVQIQFYDGLVATNAPIGGARYVKNQPTLGFELNKLITSGILGWRISGLSSGTPNAYLDITYGY